MNQLPPRKTTSLVDRCRPSKIDTLFLMLLLLGASVIAAATATAERSPEETAAVFLEARGVGDQDPKRALALLDSIEPLDGTETVYLELQAHLALGVGEWTRAVDVLRKLAALVAAIGGGSEAPRSDRSTPHSDGGSPLPALNWKTVCQHRRARRQLRPTVHAVEGLLQDGRHAHSSRERRQPVHV